MFKLESKIMRPSKILIVNLQILKLNIQICKLNLQILKLNLQICKLNLQIRKVLDIEIPIAKHAERRSGFLQEMVFGLCGQFLFF